MGRFIKTESGLRYSEEGNIQQCVMCDDGNQYHWAETCPVCQGSKYDLKFEKKKRVVSKPCRTCRGEGTIKLTERKLVGICPYCNGTRTVEPKITDRLSEDDIETISKLINFENIFSSGLSSELSTRLAFDTCGGTTDYGRYKKLSKEEFKNEVLTHFKNRSHQYILFYQKNKVVKSILIFTNPSGWTLKIIF